MGCFHQHPRHRDGLKTEYSTENSRTPQIFLTSDYSPYYIQAQKRQIAHIQKQKKILGKAGYQLYSMTLKDGSTYQGQLKQIINQGDETKVYVCEGFGEWKFYKYNRLAYRYEGYFKNDRYEGKGYYQGLNVVYSGQWKNGNYHGIGKIAVSYKQYYKGQFKNGLRDGKGFYKAHGTSNSSGIKIKGIFKEDLLNGIAKVTNEDYQFEGLVKDNMIQGYGVVQQYSNKYVVYRGFYHKNQANGFGVMESNSKQKYVGMWKNGKKQGKGIQIHKNEHKTTTRKGQWLNGQFKGPCEIEWEQNLDKLRKEPFRFESSKNPLKFINIDDVDSQDSDDDTEMKIHLEKYL